MEDNIENFEMKERKPIYVFFQSRRQVKNLSKYGEIVYVSEKRNFACLYIDEEGSKELVSEMRRLPYIKQIKQGYLKDLAENFNEAFEKTNEEMKI